MIVKNEFATKVYPMDFGSRLLISQEGDNSLEVYLGHLCSNNKRSLEIFGQIPINISHSERTLVEEERIELKIAPSCLGLELFPQPRGILMIKENRNAVYLCVPREYPCPFSGFNLRFNGPREYFVIREKVLIRKGLSFEDINQLKNSCFVSGDMIKYIRGIR